MQVYIGIDWSEDKHDVVFMNEDGVGCRPLDHPAQPGRFVQLDATRRKLGLTPDECVLGLEAAHNLIIEYLCSQAYQQVYVIPASVVKSNGGASGRAGLATIRVTAISWRISCAQSGDACSPGTPTAC